MAVWKPRGKLHETKWHAGDKLEACGSSTIFVAKVYIRIHSLKLTAKALENGGFQ